MGGCATAAPLKHGLLVQPLKKQTNKPIKIQQMEFLLVQGNVEGGLVQSLQ